MPIRPPVKAVLRKDLLLGGGAGGLLCALIAGAVLGLGPLLGIDWNGTPDGANGTSGAVALPAIPATSPQAADALRQRAVSPSVIARRNQPTTSPAARRQTAPAATPSRPAPSVVDAGPAADRRAAHRRAAVDAGRARRGPPRGARGRLAGRRGRRSDPGDARDPGQDGEGAQADGRLGHGRDRRQRPARAPPEHGRRGRRRRHRDARQGHGPPPSQAARRQARRRGPAGPARPRRRRRRARRRRRPRFVALRRPRLGAGARPADARPDGARAGRRHAAPARRRRPPTPATATARATSSR